jgi:predicted phosphodiesterase
MGDFHYGSIGCTEHLADRVINRIARTPNAYWVGLGDYIEAIDYRHKYFDPTTVADWLPAKEWDAARFLQHQYAVKKLLPIQGTKCLGMVEGNHDSWFRGAGFPAAQQLAAELRAPYQQEFGYIPLNIEFKYKGKYQTLEANLAIWHGAGGGQTPGAKVMRLVRAMGGHSADVLFMGHTHNKAMWTLEELRLDTTRTLLGNFPKRGINSGAYLRGYVEHAIMYPAKSAMQPTTLGPVCVGIYVVVDPKPRLEFRTFEPRID